ncbi:hypothetical protein [Candidatus Protofrankia californiensis]|uniref:hypothetical protein n=1 Tax=Candidatus Protofrankia californiensis TaxID=1839754 RepID=UPI0010417629|nr:hypothetical protein [Candidatus Protofrankia californiensis]
MPDLPPPACGPPPETGPPACGRPPQAGPPDAEDRDAATIGPADRSGAHRDDPAPADGTANRNPTAGEPPAADTPGGDECTGQDADQDAAFASLVARFDAEPVERTWPSSEDVTVRAEPPSVTVRPIWRLPLDPRYRNDHFPFPADGTGTGNPAGDGTDVDLPGIPDDPDASDDPYDPSDHYEPPPPPPIPRMQPTTRWALCSIALGVAILLVPTIAGIDHGRPYDVGGVMLVLGGVATLVLRMGDRPPTDSADGDDGAVV